MPTIKLGARPTSFARTVKTKDIDGSDLLIPVTFKYRTRKEYGAWIDTLPAQPTTADAVVDGKFSAEKYIELVSAWNANKIAQCVDSWGLDVPFDAEAIKQLCDESPAAAEAVIGEYQAASIEGRLGN
jgi:hypothetical protein